MDTGKHQVRACILSRDQAVGKRISRKSTFHFCCSPPGKRHAAYEKVLYEINRLPYYSNTIYIVITGRRAGSSEEVEETDSPRSFSIENSPNKRLPRGCPSNAANKRGCQPHGTSHFIVLLYKCGTVSRVLYRVWYMPTPHRGGKRKEGEKQAY